MIFFWYALWQDVDGWPCLHKQHIAGQCLFQQLSPTEPIRVYSWWYNFWLFLAITYSSKKYSLQKLHQVLLAIRNFLNSKTKNKKTIVIKKNAYKFCFLEKNLTLDHNFIKKSLPRTIVSDITYFDPLSFPGLQVVEISKLDVLSPVRVKIYNFHTEEQR